MGGAGRCLRMHRGAIHSVDRTVVRIDVFGTAALAEGAGGRARWNLVLMLASVPSLHRGPRPSRRPHPRLGRPRSNLRLQRPSFYRLLPSPFFPRRAPLLHPPPGGRIELRLPEQPMRIVQC
jgi:hypothetical protein